VLRGIRVERTARREKPDEIVSRIGALAREGATLTLRFAEMEVDFANLRPTFQYELTISTTVLDGSSSAWS
jgi:hypothetical protein